MKRKIVKRKSRITDLPGMMGTLECGHRQTVKHNQNFATCKTCKREAEHRERYGLAVKKNRARHHTKKINTIVNDIKLYCNDPHDMRSNVVDMLTDALHWCFVNDIGFDAALETAKDHFDCEIKGYD